MSWKCPECSSVNNDFIVKCVCGYEASGKEEKVEIMPKEKQRMSRQRLRFIIFCILGFSLIMVNIIFAPPRGKNIVDSFGRNLLPGVGLFVIADVLSRIISKKIKGIEDKPEIVKDVFPPAKKCLQLGILSLVLVPLAPFAIYKGLKGYREIKRTNMEGRSHILFGIALGCVGTFSFILLIVITVRAILS